MTFAESVQFLYSLGHELKAAKWDLVRIRTLLQSLGHPERLSRFIHIAGTNGKGSTCSMIESALRAAGIHTGLFTSPHLIDPRERIKINGETITESAWLGAFDEVHVSAEDLLARNELDAHPSFFETITAMAFAAFAQAGVEVAVLETGLGGRLDATNVVDPEICVITPIDFDHEAFLGSSIQSIAAEKAGILKSGRPAVFAEQRPDAFAILNRRALELDVPVTLSATWRIENLHLEKYDSRFTLRSGRSHSAGDSEIDIECPLAGMHQVENARTAVAALHAFGLDAPAIRKGISRTSWPGRLERVSDDPEIVLDGAHNPAGARALAAYIRRFYEKTPVRIVYGAMRDKAVDEVTGILFPLADEVILTAPDQPRALNPESAVRNIDHPNVRTAPSVAKALSLCRERPMPTFVTGSLYLVGEARALYLSELRP